MMHRSMMQVYVSGSDKAAALYQKAFDAELVASYPYPDGTFMHAELNVYGQIVALSEAAKGEERVAGTTMQFCLHFGKAVRRWCKRPMIRLRMALISCIRRGLVISAR